MIFNYIVIAVRVLGDFLFYIVFLNCAYWFIFYKFQQKAYILIPNESLNSDQYSVFKIFVVLMFLFKIFSILMLIRKQVNADIFFIDFEKPKLQQTPEEKERGVSVWRTLFVANEFNELQYSRTVNIELTLIFLNFFLNGLGWESLACETPEFTLNVAKESSINSVMKFFLESFIFFVIGFVQILIEKLFIIWFPTQIENFCDLCSISNISIFILDELLHGTTNIFNFKDIMCTDKLLQEQPKETKNGLTRLWKKKADQAIKEVS